MSDRETLEARWFALTREEMPRVASEREWPVHLDHCFQRILLDNACAQPWRKVIEAPAYRHASDDLLRRAIVLGEAALAGERDLAEMNRHSLALRGKL
ncbi:GCN5-related N-acetyltransferase [Aurantiacibacter poecillastricola]|uniref:GCN5-related N-acetyltransferase n=1 Tax=Aurantiacibacter poecillastricola TaxID=3064385 RepID=UPI00273EA873|nr:GCN5-related N-acetyltransferase [Aurantiacibacter sp. 219JJ12-13]MDP5261652.1 GCN5-related N-acetyltransferase [Aurantiacibacter sp. 219JJ12-13]